MEIPPEIRARVDAVLAKRGATRGGWQHPPQRPGTPPGYITRREEDVVRLIADGLVNVEIGERLCVTEETVKSHVRHILARTESRNRAHLAARWAKGEIPVVDPLTGPPQDS